MRDALPAVVLVALLIGGVVWWHVTIWNECRSGDHSVIYCLNMMRR